MNTGKTCSFEIKQALYLDYSFPTRTGESCVR